MMPAPEWIPGVFVTAVSRGGCAAMQSCEIFVQQNESYPTFAAAQQQSIHIGIAPEVSSHFVGIHVGDKVDVYGHAFRDTQNGMNELLILVTMNLPGCMKVVGAGAPVPVAATLDELTTAGYETNGPVLVTLQAVSGKPHMPTQTFALWNTATGPTMPLDQVTSVSPFFLPGAAFTGFTPEVITNFQSVTGVFGQFIPPGTPVVKYEELYVRSMMDIVP
jgi:hypothetical protein